MIILDSVRDNPGIRIDKILGQLPRVHVEDIYPGLNPVLLEVLVEELEIIGYLEIEKERASLTDKGEAKLEGFINNLSPEERDALEI